MATIDKYENDHFSSYNLAVTLIFNYYYHLS